MAADGGAALFTGVAAKGDGPPQFLPAVHQLAATRGGPLFLQSRAVGKMPISYQWSRDRSPLGGETNLVLSFSSFEATQAGAYFLTATNEYGSSTQRFYVYEIAPTEARWVDTKVSGDQVTFEILEPVPFADYTLETSSALTGSWDKSLVQPEFDALLGTFKVSTAAQPGTKQFYRLIRNE